MALWGTADNIYSPGTVEIDYANNQVIGTGTSFTAATVGSVITVGTGRTFGEAVIIGITSDRVISIASTGSLSGAPTPTGVGYSMSQKPVFVLQDSHYSGLTTVSQVYGVDPYEAGSVVTTKYAVTHAGWVGIKTYIDSSGELRVKTETLVAFSGISTGAVAYGAFGDAGDDAVFPDEYITISAQPSNVGVATTALPYNASFAVTATATPGATLVYAWQYASSVGAAFTALSNSAVYSGTSTAGLGITVTDQTLTGYNYRVVITTSGGASATSDAGVLTVTP
jgi:hypothetical protein